MGYRNEIAYVVAFHHSEEPEVAHAEFLAFQEWVKQHSVDEEPAIAHKAASPQYGFADACQDCDHFKWYPQNGMLMMRWEDVKWYENYPSTQWHEQILGKCLLYQTGAYRFVRIGERYNDIEVVERGGEDAKGYYLAEWVEPERGIIFSPPDETLNNEETT